MRSIGLGYLVKDFCRSCKNKEDEETIIHILCTCAALGRRRKRHLGAYYVKNPDKLSCMDIVSLNRFIGSFEWFLE